MARKRILFIDKDGGFVRDVAAAAQGRGFDAILAASSTEGMERAQSDRPDLIVVNVELSPSSNGGPTNGWSVCTKLKKDDDFKNIPVILTSSDATPETFEKHKKLKTRADEYLLKPYAADELIRVVGTLIGMPEIAGDEDLVIEDESLATHDFDMSGLDEEIPVLDDEPLPDASASLNGAMSEESYDPLAASGPLVEESLGELPPELGDLPDELASQSGLTASDEMAAFDESFDKMSGEALADYPAQDLAGAPPPLPPLEEEALAAPLEEGGFEAEAAPVLDDDGFAEFSDDSLVVPEAEAPAADEVALSQDDLAFDDTPLEAPVGAAAVEYESDLAAPLEAEAVAAVSVNPDDARRMAELEARVAELEAEIEGYKATEGNHDEEIERLRVESSTKARESEEIHEQLLQRDKTIRELKETESRLTQEARKARDEGARREAAMKSFSQKTETMSAQVLRLERELATAREEIKAAEGFREQHATLEQARQEADTARASLQEQLEAALRDHDSTKAAHTETSGSLDAIRGELEAARASEEATKADASAARAEIDSLKAELARLRSELSGTQAEVEMAKAETESARSDVDAAKAEAEAAKTAAQADSERAKAEATAAQTEATQARADAEAAAAAQKEAEAKVSAAQEAQEAAIAEAVAAKAAVQTARAEAQEAQARADTAVAEKAMADAETESARAEATKLREQVEAAAAQSAQLTQQTQQANERATRARAALRQAAEHLGIDEPA